MAVPIHLISCGPSKNVESLLGISVGSMAAWGSMHEVSLVEELFHRKVTKYGNQSLQLRLVCMALLREALLTFKAWLLKALSNSGMQCHLRMLSIGK
jgi:hypothetical protein